MRPVESILGMGRSKGERGGEFNYDVGTFVNLTMHPQCNNNMTKKVKKKFYLKRIRNIPLKTLFRNTN
jgi:hypothetical protein